MDTLIALYPGQGSQKPGMALDLYSESKQVRELFSLAGSIGGMDLYQLLHEGSEEELKQTKATQLAVTLASRSAYLRLQELGFSAVAHSGFSLGELAAYAGAGIFTDETLFELVVQRAALMDAEAKKITQSQGKLGMAAIIGLDYASVTHILEQVQIPGIYASNDNSPSQVVIAGFQKSITNIKEVLEEKGARRVIPLRVSGPFHTPLMDGARQPFAAYLETLDFLTPRSLVISSVDGKPIQSAQDAKEHLIEQLAKPVRWSEAMTQLAGIASQERAQVAEVGFGTVLSGLWKNSIPDVPCRNLGKEDAIQAYRKEMKS